MYKSNSLTILPGIPILPLSPYWPVQIQKKQGPLRRLDWRLVWTLKGIPWYLDLETLCHKKNKLFNLINLKQLQMTQKHLLHITNIDLLELLSFT